LSRLLNDPKVKTVLIQSNTSGSAEITKPNLPPQTNSGTKKNKSDSSEYAQKLRELKKLKDEGLLTDKEYEQKRKSIVEGI
jgi:cytochrome c-type biogenesis protein CcmH/NrfG